MNVTNSSASGSGSSGLTAAEKQQLEKVDVLEKEVIVVKELLREKNFKGNFIIYT